MRKLAVIALPVILGVSVNQINVLVDKTLASQISVGGISTLNYASRLNLFIQGIFGLSISTALYPHVSKMAANNDMVGFKKSVGEACVGILLLIVPATVGAIIFAEQLVGLLFGRGAFDANAVSLTSSALVFYSVGMVGVALKDVLSKSFYSLQDTKTPHD